MNIKKGNLISENYNNYLRPKTNDRTEYKQENLYNVYMATSSKVYRNLRASSYGISPMYSHAVFFPCVFLTANPETNGNATTSMGISLYEEHSNSESKNL